MRFTFPYLGIAYDQVERYYLVRVDSHEVAADNWQESEKLEIQEHRWWTVDEVAVSTDRFRPVDLAALLPPILRGQMPHIPIEVSAGVI